MGAWGEGNFQNDAALDTVASIADVVDKELVPPAEVEDVDLVMAAVAIRKALVEHCHATPPERPALEALKAVVLAVYDEQIDGLKPKPGYKENRRRTIVETFDQFLGLLKQG